MVVSNKVCQSVLESPGYGGGDFSGKVFSEDLGNLCTIIKYFFSGLALYRVFVARVSTGKALGQGFMVPKFYVWFCVEVRRERRGVCLGHAQLQENLRNHPWCYLKGNISIRFRGKCLIVCRFNKSMFEFWWLKNLVNLSQSVAGITGWDNFWLININQYILNV